MNNLTEEQKLFHPSNPIIKSATLESLKKLRGVDMVATENFMNTVDVSVPAPLGAKADVIFGAIYGSVTVTPTSDHLNCIFDHSFWGVGVVGGSVIGFMYTAYENWDAFSKMYRVSTFRV